MKMVFILFYVLIDSTGADQLNSIAMYDLGACEQQRTLMNRQGIITGNECVPVHYSVDGNI